MQHAVERLKETSGAVRHGSESFNFGFPQEMEEEFLVIDGDGGLEDSSVGWKKMNVSQLQDYLRKKIDNGYTFPLNPKWILCDSGWKQLYEKLEEL